MVLMDFYPIKPWSDCLMSKTILIAGLSVIFAGGNFTQRTKCSIVVFLANRQNLLTKITYYRCYLSLLQIASFKLLVTFSKKKRTYATSSTYLLHTHFFFKKLAHSSIFQNVIGLDVDVVA